jgi:hypothetical protein
MQRAHQRSGLGFAVADDHRYEQIGIVEDRPKRVRHAITQFAALVDRPGRLRRAVAADAAGKRKLFEELAQAVHVLRLVRIDLGVASLEIGIGQRRRGAMSGASDVDRVQVVFLDETIEMDPHKTLTGVGTPMADETFLDVFGGERFAQQRVVTQIQHAQRQVIARAPVRVDIAELIV